MSLENYLFPIIGLAILGAVLFALAYFRKRVKQSAISGRFFDSSQGPLYYEIHGTKGPFVVCIHGLGASSYCWRHVAAKLSEEHRVLVMDLWGFGHSTKFKASEMNLDRQIELINELLDDLQINKFHILGHSMGGHLALWYSYLFPRKVIKLMTVAPAAHPVLAPARLKGMSWVANWTPWLLNRSVIRRVLKKIIINHSIITDKMVEAYFQPYQDPNAHLAFAAGIKMIADPRVFQNLSHIENEVLILWGEKDRVIDSHVIEEILQKLKKPVLISSPRSGHMPLEDDHNWISEQLLLYLKS